MAITYDENAKMYYNSQVFGMAVDGWAMSGNILLGVTGGVAAYKTAVLARLLIKANFCVKVMMTKSACAFITPLTFQALTGEAVHCALLDETAERGMGHIELAKWADLVVIAPASANTLAKLAVGLADNLLTTVCLATSAPIVLAPAMNQQMWANKLVQNNINKLSQAGFVVLPPDEGVQACGDVGVGRMPEPEVLLDAIGYYWAKTNSEQVLANKSVVINAGATIEPIDPVRFLSNHSSGKMGFALAVACRNAGAKVVLIAGAGVNLPIPYGVSCVQIKSADDMLNACLSWVKNADIFVATAAVADFKMADIAKQKIKKGDDERLNLTLTKTADVLATITQTYPDVLAVGFAAETNDASRYAKDKLKRKKLAMVVCNDVSDNSIGFASDDNAVTVFFADQFAKAPIVIAKANKIKIAEQLVAHMASLV